MRRTLLRTLFAASTLGLVSVGVAGSRDDEKKTDVPAVPTTQQVQQKASSAKVIPAPKKVDDRPAKPRQKNDSRVTITDWLNAGANVAEAVGELFDIRATVEQPNAVLPAPGGAPAANAPLNDADFKQFETQFGKRFWMVSKGELHFLRQVCQPTRQQFEKAAAAVEPDVMTAMRKCAAIWNEQRRGQWRADPEYPDAHKIITAGLARAVKANIGPEQAERYQKELSLREAARKRAIVEGILVRMDNRLVLSPEQRDKLREVLLGNWNSNWNSMQMFNQGDWYFPIMPEAKILAILTKSQKAIWNGVYKGQSYWGIEENMLQQVSLPDEQWPEDGNKR
jgi:hypothetical protein